MMQTLVTGGTGFVGKNIVEALVAQKESVAVMTRDPLKVAQDRRVAGAHYVQGDITDPASLEKALTGCDAIVHCVQFPNAPFENPKKGWTYQNIDGQGTVNLCNVAKQKKIDRIIYLSGLGAGQNRKEPWFVAKDRAEEAIEKTMAHPTILRPSIMYGPDDRSLNRLLELSKLPLFFGLIGDGSNRVAPLYVKDLAQVVSYSLNRKKTFGCIFELGGPHVMTFKQMLQKAFSVTQKKRIFIPIPVGIIKYIAHLTTKLLPNPIITKDGIDFLVMDIPIEPLQAHQHFPFTFTPLEEGLGKYL